MRTANVSKDNLTAHNFTVRTTLLLTRLLGRIQIVFNLLFFGNVSSIIIYSVKLLFVAENTIGLPCVEE